MKTPSPFDQAFDRVATQSAKWTAVDAALGIENGPDVLPMWVADMDFKAPAFLTDCVRDIADSGDFGYFAHSKTLFEAIQWWMKNRHGWDIETSWITPTASLGNAISFSIQTWTQPGDGVAFMTPVYHEFAGKVARNGRVVTELPLAVKDGHFALDIDGWQQRLSGAEKMLLLCSPHNPVGRVWTQSELKDIADFCLQNDMLLVSDEVHHDLIMPGYKHIPTAIAAPHAVNRMVVLTSASKTFSIAGTRLGAVTIPNDELRNDFKATVRKADLQPNLFGVALSRAAYSPEGAAWVDALTAYIGDNAALFKEGVSNIKGARTYALEGTYLAWVDFTNMGMSADEVWKRVTETARIAPTPGKTCGTGGEMALRFNLGTQSANVIEAVSRLQHAFSDLQ